MTHIIRVGFLISLILSVYLYGAMRGTPDRLSDDAFWQMIDSFSEKGAPYTAFYISNESGYAEGVRQLVSNKTQGGAYLGVGAEQNFTYIAAVRPKIAFIVDIRRENMLEHLMYKALFEISPTRSAFVSRLLSRVEVPVEAQAGSDELFRNLGNVHDGLSAKTAQEIREDLQQVHRFPLSDSDLDSIGQIHKWLSTHSVTYSQLIAATDRQGVQRSYLASEESYLAVRDLQKRNLIIPVTGDFAGTKALKSIADYVNKAGVEVRLFYTSNVEQSLRGGIWRQFYTNIGLLPLDPQSVILRAISDRRGFVLTPCPAEDLFKSFRNGTRKGFDPICTN